MIKIDKYIYRYTSDIFVQNFQCTPKGIKTLLELLSQQSRQPIFLVIDDLPESALLSKLLVEYQIKYFINTNKHCRFLLAAIPADYRNIFARMVQEWNVGSMFLFNLKNSAQWEECCKNIFKLNARYLIKNGMSSMVIVIDFDENSCEISVDRSSYDISKVVGLIKENLN